MTGGWNAGPRPRSKLLLRNIYDRLVLLKVVFLPFLHKLSDRQVEEQVNLHLACEWFSEKLSRGKNYILCAPGGRQPG